MHGGVGRNDEEYYDTVRRIALENEEKKMLASVNGRIVAEEAYKMEELAPPNETFTANGSFDSVPEAEEQLPIVGPDTVDYKEVYEIGRTDKKEGYVRDIDELFGRKYDLDSLKEENDRALSLYTFGYFAGLHGIPVYKVIYACRKVRRLFKRK